MVKRLFFVLMLISLCIAGAWANELSEKDAQALAKAFVNSHFGMKGDDRSELKLQGKMKDFGFYVFDMTEKGGFVIVSNDSKTIPILGYSETGNIDFDNIPSNMRAILQGYVNEIAWFQKQEKEISKSKLDNRARTRASYLNQKTIDPLLTTKWDQGEPYNLLCPLVDQNYNIVTGCVATAMAQVMYYTEKKAGNLTTSTTNQIPKYTWNDAEWGPINAGSQLNWNNMIDDYSEGYTDTQSQAVATLMKYCGFSVKMNYGSTSLAYVSDVDDALINYFGYSSTTTKYKKRTQYSYTNWLWLIYNELSQGRPVLYAGQAMDNGHAFVCDGYKYESNTDLFHINWGWGGLCDGFFVLSVLNPDEQGYGGSATNSAYTIGHEAIVGIQKFGGTGTLRDEPLTTNPNLTINSITLSHTIALGESVDVTINVKNNSATDDYDGEICLYIVNNGYVGKVFKITAGNTQDCVISFTPTGCGSYTIKADYPNNDGTYTHSGNIFATVSVVDQTPTNLSATNITFSSATIGWTNVGDATKWNLRRRSVTATIEDFNDPSSLNTKGWVSVKFKNSDWKLQISSNGGINNSQCVRSPSYENGFDYDPYGGLRTPQLTFGGSISFYAWGEGEKFQIFYSTDGSSYTSITDEISANNVPTQYTFDLGNYVGITGYIAIIHCNSAGHSTDSYLYIDNVNYTESVGAWSKTINVTSPYTLSGLTPNSSYEVQVQAVINDGGNWSSPVLFTTDALQVPENLNISDITPTTAIISWTGNVQSTSYNLSYAVVPEGFGNDSSWLQYDNDEYKTNFGTGTPTTTNTWGVMFPGSMVTGNKLTKVAFYETSYNSADITISIYSGGDNSPGTLLYSEVITPKQMGLHVVTLATPVNITPGANLWITLTETGGYPMVSSTNSNVGNQWRFENNSWSTITDYCWMIRGYIESEDVTWSNPITNVSSPYELTKLAPGTTYMVKLQAVYPEGTSDWSSSSTFITIGEFVLDDTAVDNTDMIADLGNYTIDVTLKDRTLYKDGNWNTICLPFDVEIAGSPLKGAIARTLTSSNITEGAEGPTLNLTFGDPVLKLLAGTPYIIKWDNSGDNLTETELVFLGVTISSATNGYDSNDEANSNTTMARVRFLGTYDKMTFNTEDESILFLGVSGNKSTLYYPKPNLKDPQNPIYPTIGACRAYFKIGEDNIPNPVSGVRSFVLNFGNDEQTTGIFDVRGKIDNRNTNAWYDLSGRKLSIKPSAKGVYIQGGKKVVIK